MQQNDVDSAKASFERASTFLRGGDAAMAERLCRQALNAFPRDANLLCLLGASLIHQDKAQDAEHTLARAVRLFGDFSRAHEGLAEALIMQGRLPDALASLNRAEELDPGNSSIRMKKAKVLTAMGKDDEATQAFEQSFKLTPYREDLVRGMSLQRMGNIRDAEKIYRDVLMKDPDNVDAIRLLAGVAMKAKQWGDAEALLERALEIAPDFYQGWMDLGLARQEQDKFELSLEAFKRVMRLEPNRPQGYVAAATINAMHGHHDEAISLFQKGLEKSPTHAGALSGMGHVLKTVGRQEAAIDSYRKCVQHNKDHGESWWSMANLKTFRFDDADIEIMEQQLENEALAGEPRANFEFALAKAYEDKKNYERAFEYYERGNTNRREREKYDPVDTADLHDRFIKIFSAEFLASRTAASGCDSNAPILIVGLPRSGSTLIEQILASHPDVEGTHELPDLGRIARSVGLDREDRSAYPDSVALIDESEYKQLGEAYLERTKRHRELDRPRFTDKLPNNFVHVGLMRLILPNAKIINAKRHPLDSCLGSYKQLFARGQSFTYDQFEIAEFYNEYQRLMDHWHRVMPGHVLDVQYEDVVDDLETQVRRLLEYCDLEWNDACLNFFDNDRAVKTASSEQVRQPIYKTSRHLWRRYEHQLETMIEILEPLLKDLPPDWQPESIRNR